ncbi:hypothetical protein P0082_10210 [Candidatus Haliotispira prima]|uniref:Cell surface protein SprA n=1 Tax=Candidatus Haliotispira prima TaxID=3034016 RepID=A0ABY8MFS3_9SPIO|nr:hypothetical protein P0082_10210 [Candidatus Haliotispira prima]
MNLARVLIRPGSLLFRGLHGLLYPSKLFRHYRSSYAHFHRKLLLRQCFYFGFSLSCFSALLFSIWLFMAVREWKWELQKNIQGMFATLEQQYGVQIRFRLDGLYLLHQIRLSDIQVRFEVPVSPLSLDGETSAVPHNRPKVQSIRPLPGGTARPFSVPAPPGPEQRRAEARARAQEKTRAVQDVAFRQMIPPPSQVETPNLQNILNLLPETFAQQIRQVQQELPQKKVSAGLPTHVQLYFRADRLNLNFSLPSLLLQGLKPQMQDSAPTKGFRTSSKTGVGIAVPALLQDLSGLAPDSGWHWKLSQLLENIRKISFGQTELEIYTLVLPANSPGGQKEESEAKNRAKRQNAGNKSEPFIWQEFLQTLRPFPIEIHSLELDFNSREYILEGEDIRFLLQRQDDFRQTDRTSVGNPQQLEQEGQKGQEGQSLWQNILNWFSGYRWYQAGLPWRSFTSRTNRETQSTEPSPGYLFDIQGRFLSRIGNRGSSEVSEQTDKTVAFQGLLHANGGLKWDFSQIYLIMELRELDSDYVRLFPTRFKVEYRPEALEFQALSKIQTLDWQLKYFFASRSLDWQFRANNFLLKDYLEPADRNPNNTALLQALTPLLGARLNGEGRIQILLPRTSKNRAEDKTEAPDSQATDRVATQTIERATLQLQYEAKIRAYLPHLALNLTFDGEGDLQGLKARDIQVSQGNQQLQFSGDLVYRTLLPNGTLAVRWADSGISYGGSFLLQRSGLDSDMLIIDTLSSQFAGPGLPKSHLLPSMQLLPATIEGPQTPDTETAQNTEQSLQLLVGLPPWAQPQLRTFVLYRQNSYHISAQLRIPLSQQQMQKTEQILQEGQQGQQQRENTKDYLYKGSVLYPAKNMEQYRAQSPLPALQISPGPIPIAQTSPYSFSSSVSVSQDFDAFPDRQTRSPAELRQELGDPSFYLLPILSIYGSLNRDALLGKSSGSLSGSPLELEINTLEWDGEQQRIRNGEVALVALLGRALPQSLEFLLPGLSNSHLRLRSSLLSNFTNFRFWLDELEILGRDSQQNLLIQGTANPGQLHLEKMQLRWDTLKIDNTFLWDIEQQSGKGLLGLQNQALNYNLKHIRLPDVSYPSQNSDQSQDQDSGQSPEPGDRQGWLLQGDYQLYAYFDSSRYKVAFQQLPLPVLPGLNRLRTTPNNNTGNNDTDAVSSLLDLDVSGVYPDWSQSLNRQDWQIEVSALRLQIPEGGIYFPGGADLRFAGFWHPDRLQFQQFVLLEPQRRLQGQGSLRLIRPLVPISPAARLYDAPGPTRANSPSEAGPVKLPEVSDSPLSSSPPLAQAPASLEQNSYSATRKASPPALALPQKLQEQKQQQNPQTEESQGYWLGNFRLQGALTETGIRQGLPRIEGGENLQIELSTEGQNFAVKGTGQLDATRFTQIIYLIRGRQSEILRQGTLKFDVETKGQFSGTALPAGKLDIASKTAKSQQDFSLQFQTLQGRWQLAQARYANYDLEIGSRILWQAATESPAELSSVPPKEPLLGGTSGAWLFSDIEGHLGQFLLERSFVNFRNDGADQSDQKLTGLLNYAIRLNRENYYRSSIALNLARIARPRQSLAALPPEFRDQENSAAIQQNFSAVEQELLRWRGSLYSYPLNSHSLSTTEQSPAAEDGSILAIAGNLRDSVFGDSRNNRRQNIRRVYPGFDIFLESRITMVPDTDARSAAEDAATGEEPPVANRPGSELRLFRHNPKDFEMGILAHSFWLNVGTVFPISFRAKGYSDGEDIDARLHDLRIKPQLLNILMPDDAIMKQPIIRFEQGRILGTLRLYGKILDPSIEGSLHLQNIRLYSPYFPDDSPILNIQLVSEGHIIMAKPFRIRFRNGYLYSPGHESAYLRHQALRINRYYLSFDAGGKEGIPIFYDAYGISYVANTKGSATLEGDDRGGYLNAEFELNRLLMQGSRSVNTLDAGPVTTGAQGRKNLPPSYPFSLDIRAKIGRSARLSYPQQANPIFSTRLNPRDELLISYDGTNRQGSIEGRITLYEGELYLLGNPMYLHKGELVFDETFDDFSPDINLFFSLYTYDRQGRNIRVNMDYNGDLNNLAEQNWSPTLYSQPPLSEQQLRYLVAAQLSSGGGAATDDLSVKQSQVFSGVLSHLGSSVVLKPVEELIRKGFKFDEVSLKTDLLGNLLNDYLGINYNVSETVNNSDLTGSSTPNNSPNFVSDNWLKYLDNTKISFGGYLDRNNTILLSFNIDLLYKPQDTELVLLGLEGLQIVPGLGLKFNTPLIDITWDIGIAHVNDFFITDSSLLLEWSLTKFLNRRRLANLERREERINDEPVPYAEE